MELETPMKSGPVVDITTMPSLRDLLIQAQDSDNPNFAISQQILQDARNQNPVEFANQLIAQVEDPDAPYNVLFLALVLITHCFNMCIIPISKEHRQLGSSFPQEMIIKLLNLSYQLFLNKHDAIRNTAIHLFSLIAMTQIENVQTLGIDQMLITMLTEAQCVEAVLSASECICILMLQHTFTPEEQQIIIQTLFKILSVQNCDMALVDNCIRLLGSFSYLISRLFDNEQRFLHFIGQIMTLLNYPQLKEAVYQFLDSAIIYTPALLNVILEPLLAASVEDLNTWTGRSVLIKIIVLWESLVTKELISDHPMLISTIIPALLPPLIRIMQNPNTQNVLDYTEWEPYTAAYRCIQAIAIAQPDAVLPLLSDYTSAASQSSNPFDREGAIKSLRITYQVASREVLEKITPAALSLLLTYISDQAPRVRAEAIGCLIVVINTCLHEYQCVESNEIDLTNILDNEEQELVNLSSWQLFAPFVEPLFQMSGEVEPISRPAFEALHLIASFQDFDQFPFYFKTIVPIIPQLPNTVISQAIDCLSLRPRSTVSQEIILELFSFLYSFLMTVLSESRIYSILDTICKVLSSVIINCGNQIEQHAEALCQIMYSCFTELSLSNALTVVASLSIPVKSFVQSQIPVFIPLVMKAQQRYKDPTILISAVRLVPLIINRLELDEECFASLMNNLFDSLRLGETAPAKAEILNVFCIILTRKTEMFRPFIGNLYCGLLSLVSYIENAYRMYLECAAQIVSGICHLCVALIHLVSRDDQYRVFTLSIQLINTVAEMPKFLSQINEDLVDLILCLLQNFRDETKQQIQQIPSISEILRSGLRLVHSSEPEIEQLMATLMNSVQNTS